MGLPNPFPTNALWFEKGQTIYFTITKRTSTKKKVKQAHLKVIVLNKILAMPEVEWIRISKKIIVYRITSKESCIIQAEINPHRETDFELEQVEDIFREAIYEANFTNRETHMNRLLGESYEIGG